MTITIRRATSKEIGLLPDILKEIINKLPYYNKTAKKNEIEKYSLDELRKKNLDDPDSVLVALENKTVVGFCLSKKDDMLIWLEWFGVINSQRKRGVGRAILKYLESTLKKRNAHKIWCDCRTENIKSANLLLSEGYQPICTLKNHWYGQDFILWQKGIF